LALTPPRAGTPPLQNVVMDAPEEYCRQIEAYLCRRNDGHLIRIVGPAFEQVCSWASRGIPIKVAYRGIDRYMERYYAKGPRRRPVRVEFCEADVLDVFDEWRRAVGVPASAVNAEEDAAEGTRRHGSLPAHLDRVIARLTSLRTGDARSLDDTIDAIVRELDGVRAGAKILRGEARTRVLDRLRTLEQDLGNAARARVEPAALQQIETEAETELAPFRERMTADAYDRARGACIERIVRQRARLPVLTFE
jgi:hypothetical protein